MFSSLYYHLLVLFDDFFIFTNCRRQNLFSVGNNFKPIEHRCYSAYIFTWVRGNTFGSNPKPTYFFDEAPFQPSWLPNNEFFSSCDVLLSYNVRTCLKFHEKLSISPAWRCFFLLLYFNILFNIELYFPVLCGTLIW